MFSSVYLLAVNTPYKYKMTVGIFYTGLSRFRNVSLKNHQELFDRLDCKIYDFTTDTRNDCPFDVNNLAQRGNLQVWDFVTAITQVKEDIVVRLRTDLWITSSAADAIIEEIEKVSQGIIDVSFISFSHKKRNEEYFVTPVGSNGVGDFVIIVNKNKINSPEVILKNIQKENIKSGNWAFYNIINNQTKANNVASRLFLIRKEYEDINEWDVGLDYMNSASSSKRKQSLEWYLSTKEKYGKS